MPTTHELRTVTPNPLTWLRRRIDTRGSVGPEEGRGERAQADAPGLARRLFLGRAEEGRSGRPSPLDVEGETFLDENGSFCERTFRDTTGYTTGEFVLEYLSTHGGGVRQQRLVESLPWSDSKVSRLLGELEAADEVVRHAIGREKAVFLPDDVPPIGK